jgi:hypothetical protein
VDVIISSEAVKRSGRAGVFMLARWWRCSRSSSLNSWGTGNRLLGEGDGGAGVVLAGSWSIRHDLIDIMSIIGELLTACRGARTRARQPGHLRRLARRRFLCGEQIHPDGRICEATLHPRRQTRPDGRIYEPTRHARRQTRPYGRICEMTIDRGARSPHWPSRSPERRPRKLT